MKQGARASLPKVVVGHSIPLITDKSNDWKRFFPSTSKLNSTRKAKKYPNPASIESIDVRGSGIGPNWRSSPANIAAFQHYPLRTDILRHFYDPADRTLGYFQDQLHSKSDYSRSQNHSKKPKPKLPKPKRASNAGLDLPPGLAVPPRGKPIVFLSAAAKNKWSHAKALRQRLERESEEPIRLPTLNYDYSNTVQSLARHRPFKNKPEAAAAPLPKTSRNPTLVSKKKKSVVSSRSHMTKTGRNLISNFHQQAKIVDTDPTTINLVRQFSNSSFEKMMNAKKGQDEERAAAAEAHQSSLVDQDSMPTIIGPFYSQNLYNKRTEILLKIWTDTGPFSKLDVLSVACNVMENDVNNQDLTGKPFSDLGKKYEFNKFCAQLNLELELYKNTQFIKSINTVDYRIIWRLYGIFNNAMKSDISSYGESEHSAKLPTQPGYGREKYLCRHEKFILNFNPPLLDILSDKNELKVFLVSYGRYVEIEKILTCVLLIDNPLNAHIKSYYQQFSTTIPGTFASLPTFLESELRNLSPNSRPSDVKRKSVEKIQMSQPDAASITSSTTSKKFSQISQGQVSMEIQRSQASDRSSLVGSTFSKTSSRSRRSTSRSRRPSKLRKSKLPRSSKSSREHKSVVEKFAKFGAAPKFICVKNCQYDIVKRIAAENNFKFVEEKHDWNIMWSDAPLTSEKLCDLRRAQDSRVVFEAPSNVSRPRLQKLNHFPGMSEICRKDRLARNLKRMQKHFPKDYDFFPQTWTLPTDLGTLIYHSRRKKNCTFICKPDVGSQGKGIFLVRDLRTINPFSKLICQLYISRPFLIDGYKFDLRIYSLITSCDPLRVYLYNEGIVRFSTVKYAPPSDSNLDVTFMHLTNYSLNKFSQSYAPECSKRKLTLIYEWMRTQGYNVDKLIEDIDAIVVKTMISAQSSLKHYYRSTFPKLDHGCLCFELLGFDILLDERLKPYLLEVNHSPSFNLDLPIDGEIKRSLIQDTFSKIYLGTSDKGNRHRRGRPESPSFMLKLKDQSGSLLTPALQKQFRHESIYGLNYRLIYPVPAYSELYNRFMQQACMDVDVDREDE